MWSWDDLSLQEQRMSLAPNVLKDPAFLQSLMSQLLENPQLLREMLKDPNFVEHMKPEIERLAQVDPRIAQILQNPTAIRALADVHSKQAESATDPLSAVLLGDSFGEPLPVVSPKKGEDEDEWDAFQSAAPASSSPKSQKSPHAAAVASEAASSGTGAASSKGEAIQSFDPLQQSSPKHGDSFPDLDALGEKHDTSSGNLIALGPLDEFDPVTQKWAGEGPPPGDAAARAAPADKKAAAPAAADDGDDLLGLGGARPAAAAAAAPAPAKAQDELEDFDKKLIYVFHKGEKNVVGWYSDMMADDIREAILCACDAIIDGGFVLREVQFTGDDESTAEPKEGGRTFQYESFHELENGQTYIIEAAGEREELKKITGDRWRRLKVQIEPLLHVEAVKAIERMRRGSNLLKHTHYGFPHLRQFQLSDDRKRLVWYSGAKRKEDSVVQLDEVQEIRLGQTTPVFLHYRLPMLEHLSFSLVYGPRGSKTLDLTCKDEFEFDHWVTGLKAIFYHLKNRLISKEALLGHSKRFRKALEKSNSGIKLTKLPEVKEKGHVGLDDCIEIVTHTPAQLETKMERLRERLKSMSSQVARLDQHSVAEMEVDLSLLTGQGPAYASVFVQDEDAQDEDMEIRRMHELVEQTTQLLQQARNELIALSQKQRSESSSSTENAAAAAAKLKKKESAACKHIDQLLWKAEVDLENVEDMYLRHIDNQHDSTSPFSVSIAEVNQRLSRAAEDFSSEVSTKFQEVLGWFR